MQTRRDQLHAYRFMTRRAMSALVSGEPDALEPPMRRLTVTTVSGIMVAIVVAAVFAIIGLLRPGAGNDWEADGSVVVERETGARFLMIEGRLHPALNYPSAVLASGATSAVEVELVSRSELSEVERGPTIGIPSLPDSIPAPDDLVSGPIVVCSQAVADGADVSTQVSVDIGSAEALEIPAEEGVYVQGLEGERFLLWRGRRHPIDDDVVTVLGITARPVLVGRAFLNAVPQATSFGTPRIDDVGDRPDVPGSRSLRIGQVVAVDDGSFRVMLRDGIATVTDIQARLLLTAGGRRAPEQRSLSLAEVSTVPESLEAVGDLAAQTDGLPATMPVLSQDATTAGGACATYDGDEPTPVLGIPSGTAPSTQPTADGLNSQQGLADVVSIEPGVGVLARAPQGTAVSLITEPGLRYPAADLDTLAGFGFADLTAVLLPAELLAMLPVGDALDPAAARQQLVP